MYIFRVIILSVSPVYTKSIYFIVKCYFECRFRQAKGTGSPLTENQCPAFFHLAVGKPAIDHLLAVFGREGFEEGAVTGDADDEIGVEIGVLVRREDLLLGDDVDIDEGAAHLVVRADVGLDVLDAAHLARDVRVDVDLKRRGVAPAALDGRDGVGLGRGRGAAAGRKPGSGSALWEIGPPAWRPLGVAPRCLPWM